MPARITGLWLTAFKSFRHVVVPLAPLTVLIGRNGSGQSNALDALDVLHRLAVVGDASILLEIDQYRRRVPGATPVRLWTRDVQLAAYA